MDCLGKDWGGGDGTKDWVSDWPLTQKPGIVVSHLVRRERDNC